MENRRAPRRLALILCLIPAVYLLLTVGYALLHYSDFASDTPRLIRYVLAPLGIACVLMVCSLLLAAETALMVGISATTVLATLFLFEGYMAFRLLPGQIGVVGVVDQDVQFKRFEQALPPAYTIKALNRELGTASLNKAVLSSTPDQEVMLCSQRGQPVSYRADGYGFRNPGEVGKQANVDVLVLGDSFAEGICLSDGNNLVDRLRHHGLSVYNTGSRGNGPLFELAVFGRYGPRFRPKVTLMAFFEGNDWENLTNEVKKPYLRSALDPSADFGPVDWTASQRVASSKIIDGWWKHSAISFDEYFRRKKFLRNFFALHNTAVILGLHYPKAMEDNPVYERILRRAADIAGSWGGKVVVVYLPALDRFGGLFSHGFVSEPLRHMVLDAAGRAGVGVIDLTPVFKAADNPKSLYAPDAHFNAAGAKLAAETILKRLNASYVKTH